MFKLRKCFPVSRRLALCASLVLVAGCAGHHTSSRTAQLLDDKVMTERIEAALHRASPRMFIQVRVNTAHAVVSLTGFVPNPRAKTEATQIAKGVQHVREVENQLHIR